MFYLAGLEFPKLWQRKIGAVLQQASCFVKRLWFSRRHVIASHCIQNVSIVNTRSFIHFYNVVR
jgi:hypothetical protein